MTEMGKKTLHNLQMKDTKYKMGFDVQVRLNTIEMYGSTLYHLSVAFAKREIVALITS